MLLSSCTNSLAYVHKVCVFVFDHQKQKQMNWLLDSTTNRNSKCNNKKCFGQFILFNISSSMCQCADCTRPQIMRNVSSGKNHAIQLQKANISIAQANEKKKWKTSLSFRLEWREQKKNVKSQCAKIKMAKAKRAPLKFEYKMCPRAHHVSLKFLSISFYRCSTTPNTHKQPRVSSRFACSKFIEYTTHRHRDINSTFWLMIYWNHLEFKYNNIRLYYGMRFIYTKNFTSLLLNVHNNIV